MFEVASTRRILVLLSAFAALGAFRLLSSGGPVTHAVHAPVTELVRREGGDRWFDGGFVAMVAPIRPPTSEDGSTRIVVWLKLPDSPTITTQIDGRGRVLLRYPSGTRADRAEYFVDAPNDATPEPSWRPADVRGTDIDGQSVHFHVLRPVAGGPAPALRGLRWPGNDPAAQTEATRALGALVRAGHVLAPASPDARTRSALRLEALNDCAGCHVPERPARRRSSDPGIVNRGADASGFFHASTVLDDDAPLETYRPRNANARDRWITYACAGASVEPDADVLGSVRCADGSLPIGRLDLVGALSAGDAHARDVCASRRYVYDHLDGPGREHYRAAMSACSTSAGSR